MATITEAAAPPAASRFSAGAFAVMLLLFASWALDRIAVKLALPDIPPLIQASLRSLGGLAIVLIAMRARRVALFNHDGTLAAGIWIGVIFAVEFMLINYGLSLTTATRASVFLYVAPLFVALGATMFLGERLTSAQWAGVLTAFAAMTIAVGIPQPGVDLKTIAGDVMVMGGGLLWAITILLFKASTLSKAPAEKAMVYQLAISAPLLALAAWLTGETMTHRPGALAVGAMAYQALWVVGCTFLIWYALMRRYEVSKLSAFAYITPLLGVAAGHLLLHEPLTIGFAIAVVLMVGGLLLVNKRGQPQQQQQL